MANQVEGRHESPGYVSPTSEHGSVRTGRVSATAEGCLFTRTAVEGAVRDDDSWDDARESVTFEWNSIVDYRFDDYLKSLLVHLNLALPYELVIETTDDESRSRWEAALTDHDVKKVG